MPNPSVTLRDVYRARQRIAGVALRTPLVGSPRLAERAGGSVYLKLENLQQTGSFKIRGAANKLKGLSRRELERGVITVSTGNHGRAVAYAARQLGIRAIVCMSNQVPSGKVDAIRQLGAEVLIEGGSYDEAEQKAVELQKKEGFMVVPPFDDPSIIAGQGTIGLELLEDLPEIDSLVTPLSGGGLLSGVALTMKSADPSIRVIGVSMERAPVMFHSLRAGRPVEIEEEETLADALVGGIDLENRYTFEMVRRYVDDTLLVTEEEIADAMAFALMNHHLVVEGGGAVALAAVLCGKVRGAGVNTVVLISGGNVQIPLLLRITEDRTRFGAGQ